MRLGASGRQRKRAPSRSSSTIAVAASAAAVGHTLAFSPEHIIIYTPAATTLTHTQTHENSVNGRRQFGVLLALCKSSVCIRRVFQ